MSSQMEEPKPSVEEEEFSSSSEEETEEDNRIGADVLPFELLVEVFSLLTPKQLCILRFVSRNWKKVVDSEQVWKKLFGVIYGVCDKPEGSVSWKRMFKETVRWKWNEESTSRAADIQLSNSNFTATNISEKRQWNTCVGSPGVTSGKYFFEIMIDSVDPGNTIKAVFGCINKTPLLQSNVPFGYNINDKSSWCYRGDGVIMFRGLADTVKGQPYGNSDRVGFKLDFKKKTITFYKNGVRQGRKGCGILGELFPTGIQIYFDKDQS